MTTSRDPDPLRHELLLLADKCLCDDISDAELARLDELVCTSPAARAAYVDFIRDSIKLRSISDSSLGAAGAPSEPAGGSFIDQAQLDALLQRDSEEPPPAPAENSIESRPRPAIPTPRPTAGSPRSAVRKVLDWRHHPVQFTLLAAALTLVLWVGFWTIFLGGFRDPQRPVADTPEADDGTVARLAWVNRAHWEGFVPGGRGMQAGQQLFLVSGLAELRYRTGAIVILEGPAEFTVGANSELANAELGTGNSELANAELGTGNSELNTVPSSEFPAPSSNNGYLKLGKLVARCATPGSKGFTIVTPHARVKDLGTEFGVEVQYSGAAEVVVLAGAVEVVARETGGSAAKRTRLTKGQGAFVEASSGTVARRGQIDPRLASAMRGRLQRRRQTLTATALQGELRFVAFHDLGGEPSPGNITTQPDLATTVDLIKFADGSDSDIDFRITGAKDLDRRTADKAGNPVTRPPNVGTPAGELFLASGIDLDDGMVHIQGGIMAFTFTGLDPAQLYDVALYGDRNEGADGAERFILRRAAAATNSSSTGIVSTGVTEMNTRPNATAGHVVRWTDIAPGADGTITIDISTSGSNIAYLSAVRLAEHAAAPSDANKESDKPNP